MRPKTLATRRVSARLLVPIGLIAACIVAAGPVAAASQPAAIAAAHPAAATHAAGPALPSGDTNACPVSASPGITTCPLIVSPTAATGSAKAAPSSQAQASSPAGVSPDDLLQTYGLQGLGYGGLSRQGEGQTIALVGAGAYPTAQADLDVYRNNSASNNGVSTVECTTADHCLTIENENGGSSLPTTEEPGWDDNYALGLDIISSLCEACHILLVEANSTSIQDLATAAKTAAGTAGVTVVDNPYGTDEFDSETGYDAYYDDPGVAMVAASGNSGYSGVIDYPAASPYVVSVGGTVLTETSTPEGDYWSDNSAWAGTTSGCSEFEPAPSWQSSADTDCAGRADNDVSAAAATGASGGIINEAPFSFYNTSDGGGGWADGGGTAASADIISAVYAMAGTPAAGTNPASYPWVNNKYDLNDITTGSTGTCSITILCTAGPGWDGPTGWGTPDSTLAFTPSGSASGSVVGPAAYCLEDASGTYANGNPIEIDTCSLNASQNWTLDSDGTIRIDSGKYCIGPSGSGTANGTAVVLSTCSGSSSQQWQVDEEYYIPQLMNQKSGTCLYAPPDSVGSPVAGTDLEIKTCQSNNVDAVEGGMWWEPYPVPVQTGEIVSQEDSECIDNYLGTLTAANKIDIWTCNGGTNSQEWTTAQNGTIKIGGSYCLDHYDTGTTYILQLEPCDGGFTQKWDVQPNGQIISPFAGDECIYAPSTTNGTQLQLNDCTGSDQWTLP